MANDEMLPILNWILDLEDATLRGFGEVTRLDIMDGATTDFHPEGLFSTEIFGRPGSPERDSVYGKINLKVRILHPYFYETLVSLNGLYKRIMDGSEFAIFDKETKNFVASKEEGARTGYAFFVEHVLELEPKKTESRTRARLVESFLKWRSKCLIKNIVVMPAGYRDLEIDPDGRPVKHEINDFYTKILAASRSIIVSRDMNSDVYDNVRRYLTLAVYDLYTYFANIVGGQKGFIKDKVNSRRVHDGTRGVMTSLNTSGLYLGSPNSPKYDASVLGLLQAAAGLAPLVVYWLRSTVLAKIVESNDGSVPLVNPKTLLREYVELTPFERDRWSTEEGVRKVIHTLSDVPVRHSPVMIAGRYLALIYKDKDFFKIFDSLDDLPSGFDKANVHPLTHMEMIYLCGYNKWNKHFGLITRYPYNNEDSTYPSRIHCKTTAVGDIKRELGYDWEPMAGEEYVAYEFPKSDMTVFHDSLAVSPARLVGLGADKL